MESSLDALIEAIVKDPVAAIAKLESLVRAACSCGNANPDRACHLSPEDHFDVFRGRRGTAAL